MLYIDLRLVKQVGDEEGTTHCICQSTRNGDRKTLLVSINVVLPHYCSQFCVKRTPLLTRSV